MCFHKELYLVILEIFLYLTIVLNEHRELDGYKFPVYSTPFCPRNEIEWNKRSAALNCNGTNGFTCLPNEQFTELLEFCYTQPRILIEGGICLYLVKGVSKVNGYNCQHFKNGCPNAPFLSDRIFEYPGCISLGNGCFLEEPSCNSGRFPYLPEDGSINIKEDVTITNIYPQQSTEETRKENTSTDDKQKLTFILIAILLGTLIPICVISVLCGFFVFHKRHFLICKRHGDVEGLEDQHELFHIDQVHKDDEDEEMEPLIHESQQSEGNSFLYIVEMLTILLEYIMMACQESQVCITNGKGSFTAVPPKHSLENYQLDTALIKDAFCTYQREKVLAGNEEEKPEFFIDENQQIRENAENYKREMLTMKKNRNMIYQESPIEKAIFDDWNQEDSCFIFTNACEEVEKLIKGKNLVIVAGHTGSGKSAIIQHIALQYRKQGWKVKRVKEVKDIVDEYCSSHFQKNKTMCVFNDPSGKESFDEIWNNSWQIYEEVLKLYLKTAKLVMSSRNHIISDTRITRYLVNQSHIVNIDDNKYKLSVDEKRQILTKYTSNLNLSENDCDQIVKVEKHFPLLCKLYSNIHDSKIHDIIGFFTEPRKVLEEEIRCFRKKDKEKYCALVLLILFDNDLCVSYLLKYREAKTKYEHTLKLCGLPKSTPPSDIVDTLETLKGFFVKKIGDTYHFHHDFVLEVTTHVFGTDYPVEVINYADIGFLRKRVTLEKCNEQNDAFMIHLSDRYAETLAQRLFFEMIGCRFLEVVLNPCLRNENVIKTLRQMIKKYPLHLTMVPFIWNIELDTKEFDPTSEDFLLTKISFLEMHNEISPLFALIVFCHNELSMHCLNSLQQLQLNINPSSLFPAVCCNGTMSMLEMFSKENMTVKWNCLYPIHIVSVFHNYEMLDKLIEKGADVNLKIDANGGWTPLLLASGNDSSENENYNHGISSETRRNKTVQLLLDNGADINLCTKNGASSLFLACQHGYDSTVQLLQSIGADINLCMKNGTSPLYIACQNGYDSIVKLLLDHEANINSCTEDGHNSLYIACQNGHNNTVQLLLSKGANVNVCAKDGFSPLSIACQNGHDRTVHLLLRNGADIDLLKEGNVSPLGIACFNGHDSIVEQLLNKGANINLCQKNGVSPLFQACCKGHNSTAQLLLNNGADINLCIKDELSALFVACFEGHESTVQLLLRNGADVNLSKYSPLVRACLNGQENIVNSLLRNGADINLCNEEGISPLYAACLNGLEKTVQLLLSYGAEINLCKNNNLSPLYVACFNGHFVIVQLLLSKGADINLCSKNGVSPLYASCINGHDSIVHLLVNKGADVNVCTEENSSPLSAACITGHYNNVKTLLKNGADVNICDKNGIYPLHIACFNSQESIVQVLLDKGAGVNLCMQNGTNPLHIACEKSNLSILQLLMTKGADINLCREDGMSPLLAACLSKQYHFIQLLLQNGADTNLCIKNGPGPLYLVCSAGHDKTAQLLLKKGANINSCADDGSSPLFVASLNGHYSTVQLLLSNRADINVCKKNGYGPLCAACFNGHENTAQLLLNNKANINEGMENGKSLLHWACSSGKDAIVQLLLRNGANINLCMERKPSPVCSDCHSKHDSIPSPLRISCLNGQYSTAQLLISKGADVNLCLEDGISPLYEACKNKHDSIVQLLISNGASVNLSRRDGCSPLHEACKTGHGITVQLLLSNGAEVNFCRQYIVSPLFIACFHGYNRIIELLLSNGAETNLCIKGGISSLYIACYNGHEETVQLLISNGADINLCREGAPSPLYAACQNGHDSIVQLLMRNGADVNLCDSHKASPLYIACQNGHESTVKLLLRKDADINLCLINGISPLYTACNNGHDDIIQLLLRNGADINLCMNDRVSPLYIAFECRCYKTVNILLNNGAVDGLDCGWEVNPDLVGCFDENNSTVKFLRQRDNILCNMYDVDSYFSLFVWCQIERVTRMIFDK